MDDFDIEGYKPEKVSDEDKKRFRELVIKGGEVSEKFLKKNITKAKALILLRRKALS